MCTFGCVRAPGWNKLIQDVMFWQSWLSGSSGRWSLRFLTLTAVPKISARKSQSTSLMACFYNILDFFSASIYINRRRWIHCSRASSHRNFLAVFWKSIDHTTTLFYCSLQSVISSWHFLLTFEFTLIQDISSMPDLLWLHLFFFVNNKPRQVPRIWFT